MKRETFRVLLNLIGSQPWLGAEDKSSILEQLLYEDCDTEDERNLLIDLISRFTYVDGDKYGSLIDNIALDITTNPDLDDFSTVIAAMSIGHSADSGQAILYGLKPFLQKYYWERYSSINDANHIFRFMNKNPEYKNIILVDEFVGSGRTVLGRVKSISRQFTDKNMDVPPIRVRVLASTNEGLSNIVQQGVDIESLICLDKGISDFYEDKEIKIEMMRRLESILSDVYNGRSMPTLGFGCAEALYYRQETNLPNNVFPIFWWNQYRNGKSRKTLLSRAMELPDD